MSSIITNTNTNTTMTSISDKQAYLALRRLLCEFCRPRLDMYMETHEDKGICEKCFTEMLSRVKDPQTARTIRARSGLNPVRQGRHGQFTDEDILFSGQKAGCVDNKKTFLVGLTEQEDGSIKVTLPLGAPPDAVGYNMNRATQMEKKTKAKKRCRDALDRKSETKSETKTKAPETQEEFMKRYKAMCDLVGSEEADKLMAQDFWLD
jgi:hypothetical protein